MDVRMIALILAKDCKPAVPFPLTELNTAFADNLMFHNGRRT
jgi:hypothetical protein